MRIVSLRRSTVSFSYGSFFTRVESAEKKNLSPAIEKIWAGFPIPHHVNVIFELAELFPPLMLDWLAKEFKCCITEMLEEGFSPPPFLLEV